MLVLLVFLPQRSCCAPGREPMGAGSRTGRALDVSRRFQQRPYYRLGPEHLDRQKHKMRWLLRKEILKHESQKSSESETCSVFENAGNRSFPAPIFPGVLLLQKVSVFTASPIRDRPGGRTRKRRNRCPHWQRLRSRRRDELIPQRSRLLA